MYWEGEVVTGPGDAVMTRGDASESGNYQPLHMSHRANSGAMADDPEWSPDGQNVVYASYVGGGIYIGVNSLTPRARG